MEDKKEPAIAVGLDSTSDNIITFPDLPGFEKFSSEYEGDLSPHVERAYRKISSGTGDEFSIDGREEEAKRMMEMAEQRGAEVDLSLGGNASQESVTFGKLGARAIFLGGVFPSSIGRLSGEGGPFEDVDLSFAEETDEYDPASYILQAPETDRYILTEGRGRRIDQMEGYLKSLPDKIERIEELYDGLDAFCFVGGHVLFGNGISEEDFELTSNVIGEIRERTDALLFTDFGGTESISKREKNRLSKLFSLFDVLSVNDVELFEMADVLISKSGDEIQLMKDILDLENELSTIWIHSSEYQATLSSKFSLETLERAQDFSALAGLHKVETGDFPDLETIQKLSENREFSEEGLERVKEVRDKYGESLNGRDLAVTPCYEPEKFFTTVGAGDIASAVYVYSLVK